jgi:hypothetical protein
MKGVRVPATQYEGPCPPLSCAPHCPSSPRIQSSNLLRHAFGVDGEHQPPLLFPIPFPKGLPPRGGTASTC